MSKQKKNDCLVSVVLPAYNVEKYLGKCLDSICIQTYSNLEIVIINDGSKDNTLGIIEQYAKQDERIRYISRENRGFIPTCLQALECAKGDYVAMVDSDDWIERDYIERLLIAAQRYNADIVCCGDIIEFLAEGRTRRYNKNTTKEDMIIERNQFAELLVPDLCCETYYHSIHSRLVRKELLDDIGVSKAKERSAVAVGGDFVISSELYKKAKNIVIIPQCLYHYRKNPQSMMAASVPIQKFEKRLYDSYTTFQAVKDVYDMFPGMKKEVYDLSLIKDLDACVNIYFEQFEDLREKKLAIEKVRQFIKEKQINVVMNKKYEYLFNDKCQGIIIYKLITVTVLYKMKILVKKILMILNGNGK